MASLCTVLFTLFICFYKVIASPLFIPRSLPVADELDIAGRNVSAIDSNGLVPGSVVPADILHPDAVQARRANVLVATRARVVELRVRAKCIRKRISEAEQRANQGFSKLNTCTLKSAESAGTRITGVIEELEKNIVASINIGRQMAADLRNCLSVAAVDRSECRNKAVTTAEESVAHVSILMRNSLSKATQLWNTLIADLKSCFVAGASDVTSAEFQLRQQIINCIS